MAKGWISIHRQIWDCWVWKDKPFSKGQAWIDLLLMVNHEDKKTLIGNQLITVKRGSRITSIRKLCDRWGWSNTKVRAFLSLLEQDGMIVVKSDTKKTTLTIVNYSDYQDMNTTKNDTKTPQKRHENDTKTTQKHTNNNVNNENNVNKDIYGGRKEIFEHYLSLNLIKHKKYTPAMDLAIKTAMANNGYTVDDCKTLLDRHKKAVEATKGSEYSIRARPLHEFFGQKAYQAKHLICADYEEGGKYYDLQRPRRKQGPKKQMDFNQFPQHEYTEDELDSLFEKIEMEEVDYG